MPNKLAIIFCDFKGLLIKETPLAYYTSPPIDHLILIKNKIAKRKISVARIKWIKTAYG